MKRKFLTLLFAPLLMISCNANSQQINTTQVDSIQIAKQNRIQDSIQKLKAPLPDTIFQSAQVLEYQIYIYDSLTNHSIENFDYLYKDYKGSYTFRNNPFRDASSFGELDSMPSQINIDWKFTTEYDRTETQYGTWGGGSGWTGQPVLAFWDKGEIKEEVIVGSLCQKIYFLDFNTGKASRKELDAGNPIKGSVSLNPTLNGDLYVGMGIPARSPMGCEGFNIFTGERFFIQPVDKDAWRPWHAFDSSPLILDKFLFWPGENGIIYKYIWGEHSLKLIAKMKYRVKGKGAPGIESCLSVYKNYGYFGDNHGNIICINLNNLKPIWRYDNLDDTDSSPVIEIEDGIPYVYSGCEVDKTAHQGLARIVKLNGLTGEKIWQNEVECKRNTANEKHKLDGGFYCTPLPGKGDCNDLIFANVCTNLVPAGVFVAFSKKTGEIVYKTKLNSFAWSSPVGFSTKDNQMIILDFDASGMVYLIKGKTGEIICQKGIGTTVESSATVYKNTAVIGCRGTSIYKFSIQ